MTKEFTYYKLTHPQKRIWYIDKIHTNSPLHNIGGCIKIHGKIDLSAMEKALNIIIKNNEGLRLKFAMENNEPVQYVSEYEKEAIDYFDFTAYDDSEKEFDKWKKTVFQRKFEIDNNKLYYMSVYKMSEEEYGVLFNAHHIISDGWSITLLQNQLCENYEKILNSEENFETKYPSYIEYIKDEEEYLNSNRFLKNKKYWNETLKDVNEEFLYRTSDSLKGNRKVFDIDTSLSQKISRYAGEKRLSLNTFFMTVMLIYINKITNEKDIIIGNPIFNRINKSQKNMIGMFTSTVPCRFKLDNEYKLKDVIKLVNREIKYSLINQSYPYDLLINDLQLSKRGYDSLFKVCVNYYNTKYDKKLSGLDLELQEDYCGSQSYSMQLTVKEWNDENITLNFDYKMSEYSEEEINTAYESLLNIIKSIIENDEMLMDDVSLISEEERNFRLFDLNKTESPYPKKTIIELFNEQVKKNPDKTALEFNGQALTYSELNKKSNQLALYLREKGVDNNCIVGLLCTHSLELIVSILGILKAGAAYLPIDYNYPKERINYILQNSKSYMLLSNVKASEDIEYDREIVDVNNLNLEDYSSEDIESNSNLDDLAYIIYTSGSTGKPKGVMIENLGLTNYIWWARKMYLKDEDEVMPLYSSVAFDLTVTSIFTPLISGNKIIIYESDEKEFVLYKILRENKVTVMKLTPAHLTLLKDMDNSQCKIKRFIVGGEDLKVSLAKDVYNSFNKKVDIFNEYGPTETVVGCMIYRFDEDMDKRTSVPIGKPADNVQIYILDKNLNPVPEQAVGELYISGDGVARGYLNRDDLTKERFIENPFIEGRRMYKSGDTARFIKDGVIEYIGRADNQVKIRGFRIEISEIEKYLLENEFVNDAVVVVKEDSSDNKILNAYIVGDKKLSYLELKDWLNKFLPKYMIPNNFIYIDSIPLTVNGKVNTALLPDAEVTAVSDDEDLNAVEEKLIKVMEDVLGIEGISLSDNYYRLGGDSIKAIQISTKLKDYGLSLKVKDLLFYDSIKEIAETIEEEKEIEVISQDKCEGEIEETPIIKWFMKENLENPSNYNQYVFLEFKGNLSEEKVFDAFVKLVNHHDALRINYKDGLFYNSREYDFNSSFGYRDLSEMSKEDRENAVKDIKDKVNAAFNIEESLLFNLQLIKLEEDREALLFTAHHLIVDGVSWRILLEDFMTILMKGEESLPLKTHSFKDWAEALKSYSEGDFSDEEEYFNNILNKDSSFKPDFIKGEDTVETMSTLTADIDEDTIHELIEKMNEIYNMELNEVLIIALAIALNKTKGSNEAVIELERHGREDVNENINVSRTVGWFTSMFPVYFETNKENNIEDSIKSLKEQLRKVPSNGFNFSILKYLKKSLKDNKDKLVRFNYLGDFDNILDNEAFDFTNIDFGLNSDKKNSLTALISIDAMIVNKRLKMNFEYSENRFEKKSIEDLIKSYKDTINMILDSSSDKESKEFTPSDFDDLDISQEDLDFLFE